MHSLALIFLNWLLIHGRTSATHYDESLNETIASLSYQLMYGSNLIDSFTQDEHILHSFIKTYKKFYLANVSTSKPIDFWPAYNFLETPYMLEPQNEIYQIIKRLPKGALLHTAFDASPNIYRYLDAIFALDHCKICSSNKFWAITFCQADKCVLNGTSCSACPSKVDTIYEFTIHDWVKKLTFYDGRLYVGLSTNQMRSCLKQKWDVLTQANKFDTSFDAILETALETMISDNVQYVDFRIDPSVRTDSAGNDVPFEALLKKGLEKRASFVNENNNTFFGFNFILADSSDIYMRALQKNNSKDIIHDRLTYISQLYSRNKEIISGYDLDSIISSLSLKMQDLTPFFQAYEKNCSEEAKIPFLIHSSDNEESLRLRDNNLIQTIILQASRLAFSSALERRSYLADLMRMFKIGLELKPISDQVMGFITDIRNHPAKPFFYVSRHLCGMDDLIEAYDQISETGGTFFRNLEDVEKTIEHITLCNSHLKMSVSSDLSLFLGSKPVTDDMYEAVLGVSSYNSGLEVIKQLVLDSIYMSTLQQSEKERLRNLTMDLWHKEIRSIVEVYDRKGRLGNPEEGNLPINPVDNLLPSLDYMNPVNFLPVSLAPYTSEIAISSQLFATSGCLVPAILLRISVCA